MSELVVGIVQGDFSSSSPLANLEKATSIIKRGYRGADLIVMPEYSMLNPLLVRDPRKVYELAEEPTTSKYLAGFVRLAENLGTSIAVHFVERTPTPPYTRSTTILVTSRGEALHVYSKMHLFDAYGYRESDFFAPGSSPSRLIVIDNFETGFAICYDLRFPELFRLYALGGAKLVVVQAGWVRGPLKEAVLDTLASSRAHENTVYIVVANQVGELFTGRSGVYSPWGVKELDMGYREEYVEHRLQLEEVEKARSTIPVLKQSSEKWEIRLKSSTYL
jgi:predicted amidohydrolase